MREWGKLLSLVSHGVPSGSGDSLKCDFYNFLSDETINVNVHEDGTC